MKTPSIHTSGMEVKVSRTAGLTETVDMLTAREEGGKEGRREGRFEKICLLIWIVDQCDQLISLKCEPLLES